MFNPLSPLHHRHAVLSTTGPTRRQPDNTPLGNHSPYSLDLNIPALEEAETPPAFVRMPMKPEPARHHSLVPQRDKGKQKMHPEVAAGQPHELFQTAQQTAQEVHAAQLPDAPWRMHDEEDYVHISGHTAGPSQDKGKRKASSPPTHYRRLLPRPSHMPADQSVNLSPAFQSNRQPFIIQFSPVFHPGSSQPVNAQANVSPFFQQPPGNLEKAGLFRIPKAFLQAFQSFCREKPELLSNKRGEITKEFVKAYPSFASVKPASVGKYIFSALSGRPQLEQKAQAFYQEFGSQYVNKSEWWGLTVQEIVEKFKETNPNSSFGRLKAGTLRNYIHAFFSIFQISGIPT